MNASRYLGATRRGCSLVLQSTSRFPKLSLAQNAAPSSHTLIAGPCVLSENIRIVQQYACGIQKTQLLTIPLIQIDPRLSADEIMSAAGRGSPYIDGDVLQIISDEPPALSSSIAPMEMSSTLKKRRLKMNKHKYRKRRKRDRRRSK